MHFAPFSLRCSFRPVRKTRSFGINRLIVLSFSHDGFHIDPKDQNFSNKTTTIIQAIYLGVDDLRVQTGTRFGDTSGSMGTADP
jgi:hypothetical protein